MNILSPIVGSLIPSAIDIVERWRDRSWDCCDPEGP